MSGYIQFFRSTPPLVQLYFFYFAVDAAVVGTVRHSRRLLSSYGWAVIALSFFAGAFNTEIFRAGIEAVPSRPSRLPQALGYSRFQILSLHHLSAGLSRLPAGAEQQPDQSGQDDHRRLCDRRP